MKIIGVTGTGSLIGQAIIKSIKNSKFKNETLIGLDYFENTIGSYWTDINYILPDILNNEITEEVWLKEIFSIIKKESIDILFIGVDFELHLFSKYKLEIELKTSCLILVSNSDTINIADDKYLTAKFLKDNGFYFPKTYLLHEVGDALEKNLIEFPVIVKPRNGYRSVDVYEVKNKKDLFHKLKKVPNPLVQELIGTKDKEYTCGVIKLDNKVKSSIVLRRDLKDGNTSSTYFKKDHLVIITKYIESVANKLDQFGVLNFQLRVDDNGLPKIFEINARHSGTTYIRTLYGFNEVEYILEYLLNKKEIQFHMKEGTVKRYFEEFLVGPPK